MTLLRRSAQDSAWATSTLCPGPMQMSAFSDAATLIPLPDKVDDLSAAASLLKGLTAEMLCRRIAPLSDGQSALVTAAAGGVGTILSAWLRHRGVHVVGLVRQRKESGARMGERL